MVKHNAKLDSKSEHKGLKLDQWDIENIRNALAIYDKANPPGKVHTLEEGGKQYIEYCNIGDHMAYMRKYKLQQTRRIKVAQTKGDPIVLRLSVPPSLEQHLNKAYPMLFTDKGQTNQFLRAFPAFDLEKTL